MTDKNYDYCRLGNSLYKYCPKADAFLLVYHDERFISKAALIVAYHRSVERAATTKG